MRPIALRETWSRFVVICAQRTYKLANRTRVTPLQVGVGTPGGTETVVHALTSAIAEEPDTVVVSVDMASAVNSIHRPPMFKALHHSAPALLRFVQWMYGDETPPSGMGISRCWNGRAQGLKIGRSTYQSSSRYHVNVAQL